MKGGRGGTKGPEKDLTAGAAAADDDDDYDDDDDDEDAAGGDALETCLYGRWQVAHVTHALNFHKHLQLRAVQNCNTIACCTSEVF